MKQFGSFTLDTVNECLWRAGARIALPPKPFAVLRYLVEHPGRLVSHDELLDALWPDTYVQPQVLRTYMLDLRRILDDDPRSPRYIQSLPKRGYCFVAIVSDVAEAPAGTPAAATARKFDARPEGPVGREHELALLHASLAQAANGARQAIFITGEAGIGKTTLVDAFRGQIETSEAAVIILGQCIPGFAAQEYYPLSDAVRQLAGWSPRAAALASALSQRYGHDNGTPPAAPTPGDVCVAFEETPVEKPVLLILEDLQWADESTLHVVSALARRRGPAKLMIAATVALQTTSTGAAVCRLLHDLRLRGLCCELALRRLPRSAVTCLVRARLRQEPLPDGLNDIVYRHSEGNPRFALAMLDHLISEGLLVSDGCGDSAAWQLLCPVEQAEAATPGDLARVIELEIEHLAAHEQQVLEAGSLAPVAFPGWLVAAALAQDVAQVEEACDRLARCHSFIKRAGEDELPDGTRSTFYVFAHGLYRDVLYQRQSHARRAARHIRVAERLLAMFPGREDLIARDAFAHYEAGGDWTQAIAMLHIATRRAIETRAFGEAADLQQHIARIQANLPVAEQHSEIEPQHELVVPPPFPHPSRVRSPQAKA